MLNRAIRQVVVLFVLVCFVLFSSALYTESK